MLTEEAKQNLLQMEDVLASEEGNGPYGGKN